MIARVELVADTRRAAEFYERVFGFESLVQSERLSAAGYAGAAVVDEMERAWAHPSALR